MLRQFNFFAIGSQQDPDIDFIFLSIAENGVAESMGFRVNHAGYLSLFEVDDLLQWISFIYFQFWTSNYKYVFIDSFDGRDIFVADEEQGFFYIFEGIEL